MGRIITILIGSTPSAAGVAVKEILVGAGETKSPTRLNAVATDSLRDWICCHYLFKEYQATHSWMCISIYVQTISLYESLEGIDLLFIFNTKKCHLISYQTEHRKILVANRRKKRT